MKSFKNADWSLHLIRETDRTLWILERWHIWRLHHSLGSSSCKRKMGAITTIEKTTEENKKKTTAEINILTLLWSMLYDLLSHAFNWREFDSPDASKTFQLRLFLFQSNDLIHITWFRQFHYLVIFTCVHLNHLVLAFSKSKLYSLHSFDLIYLIWISRHELIASI